MSAEDLEESTPEGGSPPTHEPRDAEDRVLFIGYCWGAAATTWLARALNAHPDVMCLHAPRSPRLDQKDQDDLLEYVDFAYSRRAIGGAYPYVGFTHGIGVNKHRLFQETYGEAYRGYVLVRHPISRINSHASLTGNLRRGLTEEKAGEGRARAVVAADRTFATRLAELDQLDREDDTPEWRSFVHSCQAVRRILPETRTGLPIFKAEDLFDGHEGVDAILRHISDGAIHADPETVRSLQGTVVGSHSQKTPRSPAEIYDGWSDKEKSVFAEIIPAKAIEAYRSIGYDVDFLRPARS